MPDGQIGSPFRASFLPRFFHSAADPVLPDGTRLYIAERPDGGRASLRCALIQGHTATPDEGGGNPHILYLLRGRGVSAVPAENIVNAVGWDTWAGRDVVASTRFAVADAAYRMAPS